MVRKITIKALDEIWLDFIEDIKCQGVFVACGNCDEKWATVKFDDEFEYEKWMVDILKRYQAGA